MSPENGGAPQAVCSDCGASIYAEHFARNLAGHWAGQPYCHVCLEQKMEADEQGADEAAAAAPRAAVQVRTFHSKLTDAALADLDGRVNAWLNSNPQFEIKHAHSTVGPLEGQPAESSLILTVFYSIG